MTQPQQGAPKPAAKGSDAKVLLSTLRMTTVVGAVGLTMAGWGLLARADALAATTNTQAAATGFTGSAATLALGSAAATATATDTAVPASTAVATVIATPVPAASHGKAAASGLGLGKRVIAQAAANKAASASLPTATPTAAATATPATVAVVAEAVPTATPVTKFKLNVVKWVSTQAGDPVAVVQDNSGVLWYVWGPDVTRIEQGLSPEYQPQPVNATGRSRAS